jgi:molybdate transport system regulatory protein
MKLKIKTILTDNQNEPFMGIGLIWLLEGIRKYNSISTACREMDLSYTKATKMLNNLEKNLGRKVIERRHGGNSRAGAELTSFGEIYIEKYKSFQHKIKEYGEKEFKKFVNDF